jgi:two-component system nitrogen regulation sensor histidine kinase GlnL
MYFKDIWESVPYPAFLLNNDNEIKLANPLSQQYCETSLSRLVGQKLSSYIGPNSAVFEVLNKVSSNSSAIVKFDVPVNWKNKGNQVFDMYAVSVETGLSNLILFHPKRLKSKMEQALLKQNSIKSVSAMGSVLSHEIKNPLASITGASQLLESSNVKNKKTLIAIILEEAKRIENILDRVQLLGEVNRLDFVTLNIHDVIDKVKRSASQGYGSHVVFEEHYDPSIPDVNGDFDLLTQAFHNIIKNSCEAVGKKGGRIVIKTSFYSGLALGSSGQKSKKLQLMITISDNGPGISKNILDDIFDPFSTTKIGGSGLGLSLVSKIIAEHGGFVDLDDLSQGACFKVYLPACDLSLTERMH